MGSSESKLTNKPEKDIPSSPKNVPSTPIQCAKPGIFKNLSELDPRSPSENILRTPLEISTAAPLESENLRTPKFLLAIDPRSPTDQFQRTPIIIERTNEFIPKLHNKIFDNVRTIDYTPTSRIRTSIPKKVITPPKLLGSSPISKINEKRKSFVGLLETNIDYTETDLDNYVRRASFDANLTININENDLSRNIQKCENCDPRSPTIDFLRTPIQIIKKVGEIDLKPPADNVCNDENVDSNISKTGSLLKIVDTCNIDDKPTEDSVEIKDEKDSTSSVPAEDSTSSGQAEDSTSQEKMLDIVHDLLDQVESLTTEETTEIAKPIDLTADVQEFDRKLTKIIHEDDFTFKKTPKRNQDENGRTRTPMKDRNLIEPKKNKLKVSDKPRKSDYAVSKIPVFRDKNKQQCENTPPSLDVRKKRKSQPKWDSDRTMVI